ncbi:RNA binding protein [Plasmodium vivax India VII]|uniref:RNA binding protein, putative n=4 Tax=Plasmodium vivax TaxID=5855 RepID=A5K8Y4_PLAVS|nr:RNA binding protein, putative [Plasmodium vivax]KMZ77565.1 RNA binding protein [Plasmodium vivax India VII]KMZ84725.1 RNA binding protein [Plasmodium vivax Brazil I]EDL44280.1 RNA binding protein, putative [Plasmodium vivax]CAI7723818.1 pre-mRNA-splicing factor RBM22, putative [Plasmodium vivax]VUZ99177.1 pre-mRNA-splicing factor RBM22, putative [Plasmodium vivax]|eukprot:XP_001614007.1 RNA binding protein [Plasmodium vivax Sal-1]
MDRYGHNVRADVKKQGVEGAELPILCETCLGENPYVRLIKEENGKECKICNNPFTLFRWKPGQKSRYKQTIICNMCAKVKNVCQTCLFDLQYNLPVQVRDKFLETSIVSMPENETNRNFFLEQVEKNLDTNTYDKINRGNMDLSKLRRRDPYFKRNMARVCSFWRKNECNRGAECPYLHKEIHLDKSLSNQNIKSRYTGENDVLAEKILTRYEQQNEGNRFMANNICIHGISEAVSQVNVKDCFKKFGEIKSIKMIPKDSKMFISYANSQSAKNAAEAYKDGLELNGSNLTVILQEEVMPRGAAPFVPPPPGGGLPAGAAPHGWYNNRWNNHRNVNFVKKNNKADAPAPPGMMVPAPPMFFHYQNYNFNPKAPNSAPYSSMRPSEAEQRK